MEKLRIIDENGYENNIKAEIGVSHMEALVKIASNCNINYDRVNPDTIIKGFIEKNYILLLNIGLIDGKITYTIALPEILSNEQINYMENKKEFFYEKCDFIDIRVNSTNKTEYNTIMRNLMLENRIYNQNFQNRIDIVYNEINNQKRNSK